MKQCALFSKRGILVRQWHMLNFVIGLSLITGVTNNIKHKDGKSANQKSKGIDDISLDWRWYARIDGEARKSVSTSMRREKGRFHCLQDAILRDAHEDRGNRQSKNDFAPEFVAKSSERILQPWDQKWFSSFLPGHVSLTEIFAQLRKEKENKAKHPLQTEQNHGTQSNPRVKRVHIRFRWFR